MCRLRGMILVILQDVREFNNYKTYAICVIILELSLVYAHKVSIISVLKIKKYE